MKSTELTGSLILSLILSLCLHTSCFENKAMSILEDIQGDWVEIKDSSTLSIIDSMWLIPYSDGYNPFRILKDSIIITYRLRRRHSPIFDTLELKYLVIDHCKKSITLKPVTTSYNKLYRRQRDLLKYVRPKMLNDLKADRIGLICSRCFGNCPSMHVEVDNTGKVFFEGFIYNIFNGKYMGTTEDKILRSILKTVNYIDTKNVSPDARPIVDAHNCYGTILTTNKEIKFTTIEYDNYQPFGVRFLQYKLMALASITNLCPDDSLNSKYQIRELLNYRLPPPPPPKEN